MIEVSPQERSQPGSRTLEENVRVIKAWEQAPYVSAAGMQTLLNFSINPAGKTAKPEQFIDNSFVAELDKSGFIKEIYK